MFNLWPLQALRECELSSPGQISARIRARITVVRIQCAAVRVAPHRASIHPLGSLGEGDKARGVYPYPFIFRAIQRPRLPPQWNPAATPPAAKASTVQGLAPAQPKSHPRDRAAVRVWTATLS